MRSTPLLDCIAQYQMIPKDSTIFLGVSGGADSIYLLHRLYQLQSFLHFKLIALHFNHRLRGAESDRDQQFVQDFILKFCPEVPLIVDSADVSALANAQKLGIEEMARQCRYDFFQNQAKTAENSRIATAHTADDNGETVVMNLTRGAGLRGLSGIPPVRGNIIRPALTTTRREIDDYLRLYSLPHIEDSSNADLNYTRNRIRHQVMPILVEQNPNLLQNIGNITPIFRQEDELLNKLASDSLPPITQLDGEVSLSASGLAKLTTPLALRGIAQLAQIICPQLVLDLGQRQAVLSLCEGSNPSSAINLPQNLIARREYDKLVLTTSSAPTLVEQTLTLPCDCSVGTYRIQATKGIYPGGGSPSDFWISGNYTALTLRPRQEGDKLKRPNRSEKSVKKLMIDEKIPRHLRNSIPVLCHGVELFAVAGLGVNQSALPEVGEEGWHIIFTQI